MTHSGDEVPRCIRSPRERPICSKVRASARTLAQAELPGALPPEGGFSLLLLAVRCFRQLRRPVFLLEKQSPKIIHPRGKMVLIRGVLWKLVCADSRPLKMSRTPARSVPPWCHPPPCPRHCENAPNHLVFIILKTRRTLKMTAFDSQAGKTNLIDNSGLAHTGGTVFGVCAAHSWREKQSIGPIAGGRRGFSGRFGDVVQAWKFVL